VDWDTLWVALEIVSQYLPELSSLVLVIAILVAFVYWGVHKIRLQYEQTGLSDACSGSPVDMIGQIT
jgi:hypothetical protein